MNIPSLPKALTLALFILLSCAARAEDRECPTVIHPEYALSNKPLPVRLMANAAVYGFIYVKYGVDYVRALVSAAPPPPPTDLYARPLYVETRSFCPGDRVLVDGVPGEVVDATGPAFTTDPDRRAVLDLPSDGTRYLSEEGTHVEVAIANVHEIAGVDRVAVANDTLELPPLTPERDDGHVKPGDHVSDCGEAWGAFRRVYARPGQLVRNPGEQIVEFGARGTLMPLRKLCIPLSPSRYVDVEVSGAKDPKHRRGRVTGYRGYDDVVVLFDDDSSEIVNRRHLRKR